MPVSPSTKTVESGALPTDTQFQIKHRDEAAGSPRRVDDAWIHGTPVIVICAEFATDKAGKGFSVTEKPVMAGMAFRIQPKPNAAAIEIDVCDDGLRGPGVCVNNSQILFQVGIAGADGIVDGIAVSREQHGSKVGVDQLEIDIVVRAGREEIRGCIHCGGV